MNKYVYILYLSFLMTASLFFISGCSNYLAESSDLVVVSVSPAIGATGVASNENISVTFNKIMDTSKDLVNAVKFYNQNNTAVYPLTYESISWSNDNQTVTIVKPGNWIGGDGSRVYWIASEEGFMDEKGKYLLEGTVLADYYMSGFGIVGRSPYFGQESVYHPRTLEVTFNMSIDATTLTYEVSPLPYSSQPSFEISGDLKTLSWHVSSWDAVGTVAITLESDLDDYNHVYKIPAGTYILYYQNAN